SSNARSRANRPKHHRRQKQRDRNQNNHQPKKRRLKAASLRAKQRRRKPVAKTDTDKLVEQLGGMTVLELVDLKNKLEEQWGVTAAAPVAVAAPGAAAGGG